MKVKITALRKANYADLSALYENPLESPCEVAEGMSWISDSSQRPTGFCESAWETIEPFVKRLSQGKGGFYGNWMRNPLSALISCNDGFRPVSFLLEAIDED